MAHLCAVCCFAFFKHHNLVKYNYAIRATSCHKMFAGTMPNMPGTSHISTSERTFVDVTSIITVCVKEESPQHVILSIPRHV